jgi:FkbM family methyltransferase
VYERLCDDESRLVYNVRKEFALTKDETHFADIFVNRKQLADVVQKLKGKTYVIYGGGFGGAMLIHYFGFIGIASACKGIWDNNPKLQGKSWGNHSITAPNYKQLGNIDCVLISAINTKTTTDIASDLTLRGVASDRIIDVEIFGQNIGRCGYEEDTQYFDADIIISRLSENEVFIDAGCCNFGTSSRLMKLAPSVKKIYAFEPDRENMLSVMNGVNRSNAQDITGVYDFALWSDNTELGFWISDFNKGASAVNDANSNTMVSGRKLDDVILETDEVTFIKMDIEGAELEALKGAAETIKRDRPKLAVSIYHKATDYIDIAEYILSLVAEYKLYMRHYTPLQWETVLYCVL